MYDCNTKCFDRYSTWQATANWFLVQKLTVPQLVNKFSRFVQHEGSSSRSQQTFTRPSVESYENSWRSHKLLDINFNIIPLFKSKTSKRSAPFIFCNQHISMNFSHPFSAFYILRQFQRTWLPPQIKLITYSMAQSPSWEAKWFAASQEIPRISRNPKVH